MLTLVSESSVTIKTTRWMQMCPTRPEVLYCSDVTCRHCDMLLLMAQQSVTTSWEYPPIHVLYFFIDLSTASLSPPLSPAFFSWIIQQCHSNDPFLVSTVQYLRVWSCGDVRSVSLPLPPLYLSLSLSPACNLCLWQQVDGRAPAYVCMRARVCVCGARNTQSLSRVLPCHCEKPGGDRPRVF